MRNRVSLIVCWILLSALAACGPALNGSNPPGQSPTPEPQATTSSSWIESTEADLRLGTLSGLEIRRAGDGELTLARNADGSLVLAGSYTSPAHIAPSAFTSVAWRWDVETPPGTGATLQVRFGTDSTTWGEWQDARVGEDTRDGAAAWPGHLLTTPGASAIQYRVLMSAGSNASGPEFRSIEFIFTDSRPGPSVQQAMDQVQPAGTGPGVRKPPIISRAAWGADESLMTWAPEYSTPSKIIIHHTDTANDGGDPAAMVRAVYYFHAVTREWGDIGYNYLIDYMGNIYEGRFGGEGVVGGHAHDFNRGSVGISLIGNFQDAAIPAAMQAATVKLVAWLCDHYGIDPRGTSYFVDRNLMNISGHRDSNLTTCPGDRGYAWMPELRARTWDAVQAAEPTVSFLLPAENAVLTGGVTVRVRANSATTALSLSLDGKVVSSSAGGSIDWQWNTRSAIPGDHQLRATARNSAGLEAVATRMVLVDNSPPSGTIAVQGYAVAEATRAITLSLEATDVGSGVAWMQVLQGDDLSAAPVLEYQPTLPFLLAEGDGWATVSARFGDRAGLWSPIVKVVLFLDTTPPAPWTGLTIVNSTATVTVTDMGSGLDLASAAYATSPDGGATGSVWKACAAAGDESSATLTAPVGDSFDAVRFRIRDRAGNEGLSPMVFPTEPKPATPTPAPGPVPSPTATPDPQQPTPALPDLIVSRLEVIPSSTQPDQPVLVRVTVKNQGGPAAEGFWVQLYVDPSAPPTVNSISSVLGKGLFWYVPSLAAGAETVLINATAYANYSSWNGELASGLHTFYAMVDSYNTVGDTGLVLESDETNNLSEAVRLQIGAADGGDWWPGLSQWLRRLLGGG